MFGNGIVHGWTTGRNLGRFSILISLLERAHLLVCDKPMSRHTRRLWQSWEDFRDALPELLQGEDEEFRAHIERIARRCAGGEIVAVP